MGVKYLVPYETDRAEGNAHTVGKLEGGVSVWASII